MREAAAILTRQPFCLLHTEAARAVEQGRNTNHPCSGVGSTHMQEQRSCSRHLCGFPSGLRLAFRSRFERYNLYITRRISNTMDAIRLLRG